ncbi:hypothetical protein N0786_09855 [Pseudomonas aeruginosa]|nr:hypothetical protein [Pseudomonas aeruginosa]MCS9861981.1 hypothetical protein [Pseudomonas aeruginosa]
MSSTQHQLIKQCATRLRGIVEALDNIHDTSPHRWSTDLDEVHSSAESLLALIKDQAPARSEASFEEWLANELEGEDGQPVPAAVCDIALARRAFNHWPKLEQPAKVGGVRFSAGVSSRLVVEAAQRLYEFESTPEQEAERIERLQAFREQLDPLNLAPHAEAFNEAPDEALRPEQAEAERPTYECTMGVGGGDGQLFVHGDHASIKAAQKIVLERDVAQARVAELEKLSRAHDPLRIGLAAMIGTFKTASNPGEESTLRMANQLFDATADARYGDFKNKAIVDRLIAGLAAPVAQAQHSVPDGFREKFKQCMELAFAEIAYYVSPEKARDPNSRARKAGALATELHAMLAAAPGTEVPQAWLDVQAERRRQVEVEGWTPEHDDAHSHGQMARAAACYALAGSSAPNDGTAALLVSLAWPWDEQWWKPSTARRDMVKACALGLAEIERLDRVAASQGGPSDA